MRVLELGAQPKTILMEEGFAKWKMLTPLCQGCARRFSYFTSEAVQKVGDHERLHRRCAG
jgi:hypothetical protein